MIDIESQETHRKCECSRLLLVLRIAVSPIQCVLLPFTFVIFFVVECILELKMRSAYDASKHWAHRLCSALFMPICADYVIGAVVGFVKAAPS